MKIYPQVIVVVLSVNSASANENQCDGDHDRMAAGSSATFTDLPEAPKIAGNDADVLVGELLPRNATLTQAQIHTADRMILNEIHNVPNDEVNELISTLIRNAGNTENNPR